MRLHKDRQGFTLLEIMIVVAILAILIAIAVPGFIQARYMSRGRRVQNDLEKIDAALQQYALDFGRDTTDDGTLPADLQQLVTLEYFRVLPEPPVEGQTYDLPSSWTTYPTFSGCSDQPARVQPLFRHEEASDCDGNP